ncbi:MAG: hypothetical protein DRP80_04905 [Candidatus Omnitrophota bacterium]|nr:MAG: hypothetical protein DRP80_04905 [Candidatus Omnitrophota bacterium]
MAVFKYKAKQGPQKVVEAKIEAPNEELAIKKIEDMGLFPISVEEISPREVLREQKKRGRVKLEEVVIFSRQLATLIKSGVPILRGLNILSQESSNPYFRSILKDIYEELKEGGKLSQALSKHSKVFSPFYIAMVEAGEGSGSLDEVLFRLAEYQESRQEIISKVKLALIYPLIMSLVGIATVIFMLLFVVPKLTKIFENLGQTLPLPTQILILVSKVLYDKGIFILIGLLVLGFILRSQLKSKWGKRFLSIVKLKLPVLGKLILKKDLAILSRSLQLLLRSGLPILKAIELTAPIIENEILRESFLQGYKELKEGSFLGKTLKKFGIFPVFMTNLISIGEESGKLDSALEELASSYEKETDKSIKVFTTVLEPVMILVIGAILGFVVIGLLLPVFQINLIIK